MNDFLNQILDDIQAWRQYRTDILINDEEVYNAVETLEQWVYQIADEYKSLDLTTVEDMTERRVKMMLRRVESLKRRRFAKAPLNKIAKQQKQHFDFVKKPMLFDPSVVHKQSINKDFAWTVPSLHLSLFHADTTGFNNYEYKYTQARLTSAEQPKLSNKIDIEQSYAKTTVRRMRKKWKGVSRVADPKIAEKALYNARYSYRALNNIGKQSISIIVKSRMKETALRSIAHVIVRTPVTTVETVKTATVQGLSSTFLEAARIELKRQTSKSSATIDAWDQFGTEDLSPLIAGVDWTDLKQVLLKFSHLDDEVAEFIADVWNQYKKSALAARMQSEGSSSSILSAEDIENLRDADLGYMNPDY